MCRCRLRACQALAVPRTKSPPSMCCCIEDRVLVYNTCAAAGAPTASRRPGLASTALPSSLYACARAQRRARVGTRACAHMAPAPPPRMPAMPWAAPMPEGRQRASVRQQLAIGARPCRRRNRRTLARQVVGADDIDVVHEGLAVRQARIPAQRTASVSRRRIARSCAELRCSACWTGAHQVKKHGKQAAQQQLVHAVCGATATTSPQHLMQKQK